MVGGQNFGKFHEVIESGRGFKSGRGSKFWEKMVGVKLVIPLHVFKCNSPINYVSKLLLFYVFFYILHILVPILVIF